MPGPKVEKCNLNINLAGILNKKSVELVTTKDTIL